MDNETARGGDGTATRQDSQPASIEPKGGGHGRPSPERVSLARRRAITAGLAVAPVVLTLRGRSALADSAGSVRSM